MCVLRVAGRKNGTFASQQIRDRKTNKDEVVMDVCKTLYQAKRSIEFSFHFLSNQKMISFPSHLISWGVPLICEELSILAKLFVCSKTPFVLPREAERQGQEEKGILPQLALLPHRHVIDMRFCLPRVFLIPKWLRWLSKKSAAGCLSLISMNFLMSR